MNNKRTEIPIFFAVDNGYAPYLGVAIKSLLTNASKDYDYKIIIIHHKLSRANIDKFKAMETANSSIEFADMTGKLDKVIDDITANRLRPDIFTLTIYFRIFIPRMFPQYDKGLYLDCDIVVPGDISKLYEEELGENVIGGCQDSSTIDIEEFASYFEKAAGVDRHEYINSGILLMNLKKLRELRMGVKFIDLLTKYQFDSVCPDQDYINAMCCGMIKHINPRYNVMPVIGKPETDDICLIHYNLFLKPWLYDDIPYEKYFWEYAKQTEFYNDLLDIKSHYGKEQKDADAANLQLMKERAIKIGNSRNTLRVVHEETGQVRLGTKMFAENAYKV